MTHNVFGDVFERLDCIDPDVIVLILERLTQSGSVFDEVNKPIHVVLRFHLRTVSMDISLNLIFGSIEVKDTVGISQLAYKHVVLFPGGNQIVHDEEAFTGKF